MYFCIFYMNIFLYVKGCLLWVYGFRVIAVTAAKGFSCSGIVNRKALLSFIYDLEKSFSYQMELSNLNCNKNAKN